MQHWCLYLPFQPEKWAESLRRRRCSRTTAWWKKVTLPFTSPMMEGARWAPRWLDQTSLVTQIHHADTTTFHVSMIKDTVLLHSLYYEIIFQSSLFFFQVWLSCLNVFPRSFDSRLTKWFQLVNSFFPHRLNMDTCKAPFRSDFDRIQPLETVWKVIASKLCMVKQVLAVWKVPGPAGGISHEFLYKM